MSIRDIDLARADCMSIHNQQSAAVNELVSCIGELNPVHKKHLALALEQISIEEMEGLDRYIAYCAKTGLSVPYLAECYLTIVFDTLREQVYFKKHGHYRHACFRDVADDVYLNESYMEKYMYGLALTLYLWPRHLGIYRYFLKTLPRTSRGKYLEIGPGHGANMMLAMQVTSYDSFHGIDISKTSIDMTRNIIEYNIPQARHKYTLEQLDFLSARPPQEKYACIVMGEVLEHVEQPAEFLTTAAEMARDDAHIFVTTCINTPAVDHIYLFETSRQITRMIEECGLRVRDELVLPYEGMPLDACMAARLPVSVAYILGKT